jgi:lysophospholipid acyltransferase (LPLAT)-like uncharacterized protein
MVELFKAKSVKTVTNIVYAIFHMQEMFTHIQRVDFPDIKPCIYAMWHRNQMCTYGQPDISRLNVLVSRSKDGEMIAKVIEKMGYKTIRGSKGKKGAVEASMQMITALKAGEDCAMMVDGPVGPPEVAKDGVIKLAKMAGVPIVPVSWYSTNITWLKFPSWDGLRMPLFRTNLVNLYGKPIYVNEEDDVEEKRKELQESLEDLERRIPLAYKEVYLWGQFKRKRSDSSQFKWNP